MMQVFTIGQQTNPLPLPTFNLMLNSIQNGAQMAYTGRGGTTPAADYGINKPANSLCPAGSAGGGIPILNKPGTCPPERRDSPPPSSTLGRTSTSSGTVDQFTQVSRGFSSADDDLEMLVGQVLGERRAPPPPLQHHQGGSRQQQVPAPSYKSSNSVGGGAPQYMQSSSRAPPSYSEAKKLSIAAEPFVVKGSHAIQPFGGKLGGAVPGSKIANPKKPHQITKQPYLVKANEESMPPTSEAVDDSSEYDNNSSFTVSAGSAPVVPRMTPPAHIMMPPKPLPPAFAEATSSPQPSTAIFVHNIPIVATDTCGKVCKEKIGRLLKSFGALAYFDICPVGEAENRFGVPRMEMERITTLRASFRPTNMEIPDDVRYCVVLAVFDCLKCLDETIRLLNGNFTIFPRMGSIHAERKAAILAGEPVPTRETSTEVGVTYESPFKYLICNDVPLYATLAPYEDAREKRNKQKRLVASRFCPFNAPQANSFPQQMCM